MSSLVVAGLLLCAAPAWAQEPGDTDAEGCKDSTLLTRMPGCTITECTAKDFESTAFQNKAVPPGSETPQLALEGAYARIVYVCPAKYSVVQLHRNAENALAKAGYTAVFSGRDDHEFHVLTVRKAGQWINVISRPYDQFVAYELSTVKVEDMKQEVAADASGMAEAINKTGSVAIYGINFDTGRATLQAGSDQVLAQIAKVLQEHSDWRFEVQGHTDNVGAKAANMTLSDQRAKAVVAWLTKNGVDGSRLVAKGYGDSEPVADNSADDGRAKNRRVELKKLNEE
jgi:outer membrane protein OmpA-like peptidoglycan-associated protein